MRSIEPEDPALTYASVLDALPIVAFLARADGSISYLSRGWSALTGIDPAEVLGTNYASIIHPDQREDATETWRAARDAEATYRDEFTVRFGDGRYRWISSEANPMRDPETQRIIGQFGTVTEIDDRKGTEAAVREHLEFNARLLESSDDCTTTLDLSGRLVAMSPNGQKLLEIESLDTVLGTSWLDFWKGDDATAARGAIASALRGQGGRFTGQYPVAGEPRWFDVAVTAIFDAHAKPERLLVVARDITAHASQAKRLKRARNGISRSRKRCRAWPGALRRKAEPTSSASRSRTCTDVTNRAFSAKTGSASCIPTIATARRDVGTRR